MMKFTKMHGLGNDFIIANTAENPKYNFKAQAARLCDRHFGVGADGVVTLTSMGGNKYEMHIYNSDNTEAGMCGNASRCVALYLREHTPSGGNEFELHTISTIVKPRILGNDIVQVDMGIPAFKRRDIPMTGDADAEALEMQLQVSHREFIGNAVSMGNPHLVIFVSSVKDIELEYWGPLLENHENFPNKTNVEFVEIISRRLIRMRVWERGCGVTMACGTGSCASVAAGVATGRLERNVTVLLDGGELQIEYSENDNHIYMTGPARKVYDGVVHDL